VLLAYLDGYCRAHFGQEERCMEEYRCPVAARNRRAHSEFIAFLLDARRRYGAGGFRAADARRLVDMLDGWLAGHIGGVDAHLRDHVPR
jgi:hemerythrin-like metal-binding protein